VLGEAIVTVMVVPVIALVAHISKDKYNKLG